MRALTLAVLMLVWVGTAAAEEPIPAPVACRTSLACVQQIVQDCRDYRQFLEENLALAKSLLNAANERIAHQQAELQGLRERDATVPKK
jgi:hypothetical protein